MASVYVAELLAVQPEGPFALGGWSLGGVIAYEMARQLSAQGRAVERVALIDSYAPRAAQPTEKGQLPLLARFGADLLRLAGSDVPSDLLTLPELQRGDLPALYAAVRDRGLLPPDLELDRLRELFEVFQRNDAALRRYRPAPYGGPVTLMAAAESAGPPDHGWAELVPNLEVVSLPGDHYSILRAPHADALAAMLRSSLRRALAR